MKNNTIALLFYFLFTITVYSQGPFDQMVKCKTSLQTRMDQDKKNLFSSYYYPNPTNAACEFTNHKCKSHIGFCCSMCWTNYINGIGAIEKRYQVSIDECEKTYDKATKEPNTVVSPSKKNTQANESDIGDIDQYLKEISEERVKQQSIELQETAKTIFGF